MILILLILSRYSVHVSAESEAVTLSADLTSSLVVETQSGRPHKPIIRRVEARGPGVVSVEFDYRCPRTGPTVFSLLTDCRTCHVDLDEAQDGIIQVTS